MRWNRMGKIAWAALLLMWMIGIALRTVVWTQPQGELFKVALLQGNISQELKFQKSTLDETLNTYLRLIQQSDARLIVLPETALPALREELPEGYLATLSEYGRRHSSDILIGAFETENGAYYNSVFTLGASPSQSYRKNHLVPFGEFIPWRTVLGPLINDVLNIPMGDLARGGINQPPLHVAGQNIAMDICYEDVFGEEIIHALPAATLLVNVSNDAWYGHSSAAMQHNQIAQMRALETGRMMLRATNTGVTSVIGADGHISYMLPQHEEKILTATVQGYTGSTPYVRFGNVPVLLLIVLMIVLGWRLCGR
jgi:apolipoprotein N-acyltransferase